MGDFSISGSGRCSGGKYEKISISGSGHIDGDVTCNSLGISGSGHIDGNVECAGPVRVSGSARMSGDMRAKSFSTSGSAHIDGSLDCETGGVSGSAHISGSIRAGEFTTHGSLGARTVEAEHFTARGGFSITELLSADEIDVVIGGNCRAGEVGGKNIKVRRGEMNSILGWLFGAGRRGGFECTAIEGDRVDIEYVKADVVRGDVVTVGPGCKIGRVEYKTSCTADFDSDIGERVQTGGPRSPGSPGSPELL